MADSTPDPGSSFRPPFVLPTAGSGLPQNVAAGLACVFTIIGGFVFLFLDRNNRFIRFHSLQSIYLGLVILAVSLVFKIAGLIFSQVPFLGQLLIWIFSFAHLLIAIVWFVAYITTIVKALLNKEWEVPYLGWIVRKQLGLST